MVMKCLLTILDQFLISNELQDYLEKLKVTSLREIHPSLSYTSKVSALIKKQKLLLHPEGLGWAGKLILICLGNVSKVTRSYTRDGSPETRRQIYSKNV